MASADDIAMFEDGQDAADAAEEAPAARATTRKPRASAEDIAMFSAPIKDPRFVDEPVAETRPLKNTGPDLVGQVKDLKQQAANYVPPSETFIRNAGSQASFGSGPALEASLRAIMGAGSYDDNRRAILAREATGDEQNPNAATAGSVAGAAATLALPAGGALAEGASAGAHALQAAKIGGAYSAAGGAGAALSAGKSPAEIARSALEEGAVGAATGGALGYGLGKMIRGAPERVDQRIVQNIARGEAGGAVGDKMATNLATKAGEGGENLLPVVEETGLRKTLATQSAAHPDKALKRVQSVLNENEEKVLGPVYSAIDKSGTGPESIALQSHLLDKAGALRAEGRPEIAEGLERYQQFVERNYKDGEKLSGSMLRKLRGSIGTGAFKDLADENTPLGVQVKREIYGVYAKTIEGAAEKTPGVDVATLKAGNERASQLLSVQVALANRAAKAATGRSTLANAFAAGAHKTALAGGVGHALLNGNLGELGAIAATEGGYQVVKRLPQAARYADYGASQLETAARQGSKPALVARTAAELGAARIAAPAIADRARSLMGGGYSPQDEADRELARRLQAQRAQVQP